MLEQMPKSYTYKSKLNKQLKFNKQISQLLFFVIAGAAFFIFDKYNFPQHSFGIVFGVVMGFMLAFSALCRSLVRCCNCSAPIVVDIPKVGASNIAETMNATKAAIEGPLPEDFRYCFCCGADFEEVKREPLVNASLWRKFSKIPAEEKRFLVFNLAFYLFGFSIIGAIISFFESGLIPKPSVSLLTVLALLIIAVYALYRKRTDQWSKIECISCRRKCGPTLRAMYKKLTINRPKCCPSCGAALNLI